jgi:hypothetical protein
LSFSDANLHFDDGNYGIEDVRSDQESDNDDDEDETRIPSWAKGWFLLFHRKIKEI